MKTIRDALGTIRSAALLVLGVGGLATAAPAQTGTRSEDVATPPARCSTAGCSLSAYFGDRCDSHRTLTPGFVAYTLPCAAAGCTVFARAGQMHCAAHAAPPSGSPIWTSPWTFQAEASCSRFGCSNVRTSDSSTCWSHAAAPVTTRPTFGYAPAAWTCSSFGCDEPTPHGARHCSDHWLAGVGLASWECGASGCKAEIYFGLKCTEHRFATAEPEKPTPEPTTRWSARISVPTREAYRVMGLGELGAVRERASFRSSSCLVEIDVESKRVVVDLWGRHEFPAHRLRGRLPHSDGAPNEPAPGKVVAFRFDEDSFLVDASFETDLHDEWDLIGPSYRGTVGGRFKIDGTRSGDGWDVKVNVAYQHHHSMSALGASGATSTIAAVQLGKGPLQPVE